MALVPGTRLGPYAIEAPLGTGGMGEVYRATDTRLHRTVAIKLILAHAASDPKFKERFNKEAKAISALDHPHICALYDVGEQDGVSYLVMQYLEGETLASRLAQTNSTASNLMRSLQSASGTSATSGGAWPTRGPLPIETALRFGIEIAGALAAAHRRGFVHRDLKPGNVMITRTGARLLDFGLAKLVDTSSGISGELPTQTLLMASRDGHGDQQSSIVGTLPYMSPEQLETRELDARSDIFSFGSLLYEMLTGRRAFDAASQAGIIAAIVGGEPPALGDLADARPLLPASVHRGLERVLARCLAKDPDARWHSAADLAAELQWIHDECRHSSATDAAALITPQSPARRWFWVIATSGTVIAVAALAALPWRQLPASATPVRFTIPNPDNVSYASGPGFLSISPDGTRLAFVAGAGGTSQPLWIRPMDSLAARPVAGSEGGWQPTWSPDGRFILINDGVTGDVPLKRLDLSGGPALTLAATTTGRSAWGRTGIVLFSGIDRRLYQVSENGGAATAVTEFDTERHEVWHDWPIFLPDGRRFIYSAQSSDPSKSALYLASLDTPGRTRLLDVLSNVEYAAGHLVYQRDGTLMAQPFDDKGGRLTGDAIPIVEGIQYNEVTGRAAFSLSSSGDLVYRAGAVAGLTTLTWLDTSGKAVGSIGGSQRNRLAGRPSPDRSRIVVSRNDGKQDDLWLIDVDRDVASRLTFDPASDDSPVWFPDGTRVAFRSVRSGKVGIYQREASGAAGDQLMFESTELLQPLSFSPDGTLLLFQRQMGQGKGWDIWALSTNGDRTPVPVVETPFNDQGATFAPDGRSLAYFSSKSGGTWQVYVRSYPDSAREIRVSTSDGQWPVWSENGRRLFYMTNDYRMMAVDVTASADTLQAAVPVEIFQKRPGIASRFFGFDPLGPRFLIAAEPQSTNGSTLITVMLNSLSSLEKPPQ